MTGGRGRAGGRRGDEGAVLIFSLIIITTIALVVGTLLTRGDGSLRTTVVLRQVSGSSYAADAAGTLAINDLRTGQGFATNPNEAGFNNSLDGIGCWGNAVGSNQVDALKLDNLYPATGTQTTPTSAVVDCVGVAGTGQQGSPVPINHNNKPGYAIVTLNGNVTSSSPLKVHGGVYANGNIVGAVAVDAGDVRATGTCPSTTISGTATKQCGGGTPATTDPHYSDELGGAVPALQTPPTTCTGGVAVFTPGYYDNADALNTASALCNTLWFKPGNYYFDFHNSTCGTYCPTSLFGSQSSNNVWTIPRGTSLVGGTPVDAAGAVIAIPSANPTMPGSCQSPITDIHAKGVQFVFGNDSRLFLAGNGSSGAHMELCADYHADRPPIELLGLTSGGAVTSTNATNRVPSGPVTTTQSAGSWSSADAASLAAVGGGAASWNTTGTGTKTATLTVPGYTPSSTVPAGAILLGATLNVTHQDAGTATSATIQVNGASVATGAVNLPVRAASTTDAIVFNSTTNATAFALLQKQVHDNGFTGATTVYVAKVTGSGPNTVRIDASTMDLVYAVPVLRGETGTCVATGTSCSLVSLDPSGNNKIFMYLQGTTYAPVADVNVVLSNFSAEVAKFGVIARQLEFSVNTGNPSWTGPVFEIPDDSPGYGFQNSTVDLKVYLCRNQATGCTHAAGATPDLSARVQLWDPSGEPSPPRRQISVLSWSHSR
ncbi:MAG: hypothetical protein ACTHNS_10385 [Marmoricola sp.]